ncbi:MAG: class I tRNA ligase family protein, partial [Aquificaceae bacterium]
QGEAVAFQDLHSFDRWMLSHLQKILREMHNHYQNYSFHRVYHLIRNFCSVELSSLYLDVLKDRLYISGENSWERRSAQTVLYHIAEALITSIAPFLSFTAEEAWEHFRRIDPDLPESVFMHHIPAPREDLMDKELLEDYKRLIDLRDKVMKVIELARADKALNHPYEARVYLWGDGLAMAEKHRDYLKYFFTVSKVDFSEGGNYRVEGETFNVGVSRAEGKKCPRCWLYYPEEEFDGDLCKRCAEVLKEV